MNGNPIGITALVMLSTAFQLLGMYLVPMTRGLTQPLPTLAAAVAFLTGIGIITRLSYSGINLSVLVPMFAALVPLGTIAIGVLAYGESAAALRLVCLIAACALIAVANIF
jgi:multidrug transporter EmrE-like cation transporter